MNLTILEITQVNANMSQENARMNETINAVLKTNTVQATQIPGLQKMTNISQTHVFFSAGLTRSVTSKKSDEVLVFDRVWSNVGGAYSSTSGIFTCPVAGYYSFIVNLQTGSSRIAYLEVKHNNIEVFQVFSNGGQGYQSATNSA